MYPDYEKLIDYEEIMDKHRGQCNCKEKTFTLFCKTEMKKFGKRKMRTCNAERENAAFRMGGKLTGAKMEWI